MQCSLDLLRNVVIRVQVRSKVLVRELLRSSNLRLVSDPVSNVTDHIVAPHSERSRYVIVSLSERGASAPLKAFNQSGESPDQGNVTALNPKVVTAFPKGKVGSNLRRASSP